jgi:hypothetical protein
LEQCFEVYGGWGPAGLIKQLQTPLQLGGSSSSSKLGKLATTVVVVAVVAISHYQFSIKSISIVIYHFLQVRFN